MKRSSRAGVTLMELLIAVTLFSLLSVGMLYAFRIGLTAYSKTQTKLMDNRRVVGAQRILEQELQGMIPVVTQCNAGAPSGAKTPFFQGEPQAMRLVSTFSLQEASRGVAQILELFVTPTEDGRGVRLLVNEIPYGGPRAAGQLCTSTGHYLPVTASERSFVLADKLAYCRFTYLSVALEADPKRIWGTLFQGKTWPRAVRIEMAPLEADPSRLQPITITALIRIHRNPEVDYGDY
jgi:prepilin-type N-terminal cleavage/methylation domain-containing protein